MIVEYSGAAISHRKHLNGRSAAINSKCSISTQVPFEGPDNKTFGGAMTKLATGSFMFSSDLGIFWL